MTCQCDLFLGVFVNDLLAHAAEPGATDDSRQLAAPFRSGMTVAILSAAQGDPTLELR